MVVRAEARFDRKRDEHFWRRHIWMLRSWSPLNWGTPEVVITDESSQDRFTAHKVELRRSALAAGIRLRDLRKTEWEIDATEAILPDPKPLLPRRFTHAASERVKSILPGKRPVEADDSATTLTVPGQDDAQPEPTRSLRQKVAGALEKANIVRMLWSTNPVAPKTVAYDFKDGALQSRTEYLGGLSAPQVPNDLPAEGSTRITTTEQMKKVLFNPWLWKLGTKDGKNKLGMKIQGPVDQSQINYVAGEQLLRAGRDFKALSWARYLRGSAYGWTATAGVKFVAAPILLGLLSLAPAAPILTLPALPLLGAVTLTVAGAFAVVEGISIGIAVGNLAVPTIRYWWLGGRRQEKRWENRFNLLRQDRAKKPLIELK